MENTEITIDSVRTELFALRSALNLINATLFDPGNILQEEEINPIEVLEGIRVINIGVIDNITEINNSLEGKSLK